METDDGAYFLDADGDVFAHVLRYLRHGTMPLSYDHRSKGHDHALYAAVLEQAQYFGVAGLSAWLEGRKYLSAVTVERSARLVEVEEVLLKDSTVTALEDLGAHVEVEYHVTCRTEKVYICPRGLARHRGDRNACGRQCRNARGDADDEYVDEDIMRVLEVRKVTTVDPKMGVD